MFGYFSLFSWPIIIIIGLIIFFVVRFFRRKRGGKAKDWYLRLFLSREDAVSQFFFLFAVFFLGITLLAFNKDLGEPLSWRTILLFASLAGLVIAYYFRAIYTLAVSLIGLAGWWGAQAAVWMEGKEIKGAALFIGLAFIVLLLYLIGRLHEKEIRFKRVAMVYSILGLLAITKDLFVLSTKSGIIGLEKMTEGVSFFASWQITFSLFIFLIFLGGALIYALNKKILFKSEALAISLLVIMYIIIALLPAQRLFLEQRDYYGIYQGAEFSSTGIFWAIIFNILIFLELVGIILLGYMKRENWLINLGTFFLFLLILAKYFDWFFAFLDKSVFFIGAGILLFVVGWFMEKGRRYIISGIKSEGVNQNQ